MLNPFTSFMQDAFEEAEKARLKDEVPIGAVVIDSTQKIIGRGHNLNRTLNDPTAHAEIIAIRQACLHQQNYRLDNCSLYVTLEPCAMCAGAIAHARIQNLYYGAEDEKAGAVDNNIRFLHHESCHHKIEIYSHINYEFLSKYIKDYFKNK